MSHRPGRQKPPDNHNSQYLDQLERRKRMTVVDALGMPANARPQQQGGNPVDGFLLPWFDRAAFTMLQARGAEKIDAAELVNTAWDIATRAFAKIGFRYLGQGRIEAILEEPARAEPKIETP